MTGGGSSKGFFSPSGGRPCFISAMAIIGLTRRARFERSAMMRGDWASEEFRSTDSLRAWTSSR